jgi:hypothetical protein
MSEEEIRRGRNRLRARVTYAQKNRKTFGPFSSLLMSLPEEPAELIALLNSSDRKSQKDAGAIRKFIEEIKRVRNRLRTFDFDAEDEDTVPAEIEALSRRLRFFVRLEALYVGRGGLRFVVSNEGLSPQKRLLYTVVALDERGDLDRLWQCAWCHQWFLARKSDHRFCKESCKRKAFRSTSEYKERQRKYMKSFRKRRRQ